MQLKSLEVKDKNVHRRGAEDAEQSIRIGLGFLCDSVVNSDLRGPQRKNSTIAAAIGVGIVYCG